MQQSEPDEKALPSYRRTPSGPELTLRWRTSDASGGSGWAREADLVAVLEALDPAVRARVLEAHLSAAKRSGFVGAVGALHNAMPTGFVERDSDKIIGRVVAEFTVSRAEVERLLAVVRLNAEDRIAGQSKPKKRRRKGLR